MSRSWVKSCRHCNDDQLIKWQHEFATEIHELNYRSPVNLCGARWRPFHVMSLGIFLHFCFEYLYLYLFTLENGKNITRFNMPVHIHKILKLFQRMSARAKNWIEFPDEKISQNAIFRMFFCEKCSFFLRNWNKLPASCFDAESMNVMANGSYWTVNTLITLMFGNEWNVKWHYFPYFVEKIAYTLCIENPLRKKKCTEKKSLFLWFICKKRRRIECTSHTIWNETKRRNDIVEKTELSWIEKKGSHFPCHQKVYRHLAGLMQTDSFIFCI